VTIEPDKQQDPNVLLAALEFLAEGVAVVPAANDGSKRPLGNWKEFQTRKPDATEVLQWATTAQGFGVITGAVSGNLEMMELEGRAVAADLHTQARELAYASGLDHLWEILANTYVEATPSGGLHWLYRISDHDVPGNTKLARRPGENGGVDVLAETRGEGGFCIVAPSGGTTHPSGDSWERLNGSTPKSIQTITWEQREAIHAIFKMLDEMPNVELIQTAIQPKDPDGRLSPGDDYNNRTNWDDILTDWTKVYQRGGETFWRRPGKDVGISASTGRGESDNLYVWTTSTQFESEKPYSKFAAWTLLNFGDTSQQSFSMAAKQLRQLGFGDISMVQEQRLNDFMPENLVNLDPKELGELGEYDQEQSSWKPADLISHINGTVFIPCAEILTRTDGANLIYPGRVHSFYGESESGKSWLAQYTVAQELEKDHDCIYIDFEADAGDIVSRLRLLGVPDGRIVNGLTYIRPETKPHEADPFWQELLERTNATLIIIDGVTEALTLWGGESKDNDSITSWTRRFPRRLAKATGAAVITIDHVSKSADTRGRFAIGGQAKLAALDGAAFLIEPLEVLAPGKVGKLSIRVTKDRPGAVRRIAGSWRKSDRTQEVAFAKIDASGDNMHIYLDAPMTEEEAAETAQMTFRDTVIEYLRERREPIVQKTLIANLRQIIPGNQQTMIRQLDEAVEEGWLALDWAGGKTSPKYFSLPQIPGEQRLA
jgi:hypothetical protein